LRLSARSAAVFFHRDAPALVAIKGLNTKRSPSCPGVEIFRLVNFFAFSIRCGIRKALASPNNI
jgi:hypothetical protein